MFSRRNFILRYFVWILQLPSGYVLEQVLEGLPCQDDLIRVESSHEIVENGSENVSDFVDSSRNMDSREKSLGNLRFLFQVFGSEAFKILGMQIFSNWINKFPGYNKSESIF